MRLIDADKLQAEYKERHDGKRLLLLDVQPTVDIYTEQNVRDAFADGYAAGKYDSTHWIPCSERLPNVGAILISDGNQVFIGAYYGNSIWSADGCDYDPILEDIAWMPLPEPYKENNDQ